MRILAAAMAAPDTNRHGKKVKCDQAMADRSKMQWKADEPKKRNNKIQSIKIYMN